MCFQNSFFSVVVFYQTGPLGTTGSHREQGPDTGMASLHDVLDLLVEHVTLADLFRLRRALSGDVALSSPWTESTWIVVTERMGLKRRVRSVAQVARRMSTGRRCLECGRPTACRPAFCTDCTSDPRSPVFMCDRHFVRELNRGIEAPLRHLELAMRTHLVPVKVAPPGKFMYWHAHVLELLTGATGRRWVRSHGIARTRGPNVVARTGWQ